MLSVFTFTYAFRFLIDFIVIPHYLDADNLIPCNVAGNVTFCLPYGLILYYILSSLVYDFVPIFCIEIFHFKSFQPVNEASEINNSIIRNNSQQ